MRIAQVAPLAESVPPKYYGGTERVVSYLTEELVRRGHDVTLFASGDSVTSGRLVSVREHSCRLHDRCLDGVPSEVLMLEQVLQRASEFDVVHFHVGYLHFPAARRERFAHLTTLHGRLDTADLAELFREFSDVPVVSISDAQRGPLPSAMWQATVHHGLPADLYSFCDRPGEHLAFLGRISPEKRVDLAIEVARRAGMLIRIAAKVDASDRDYFEGVVRPLLRGPGVEFLGEVSEAEKSALLADARALLFTIDWPEPFGIVMIEALACGTPVIAFRRGSVPEVIDDGRTGFIVDSLDEAVDAVARVGELRRARCRREFERRFSAERMAGDYLDVYERLVEATAPFTVAMEAAHE